MFKIGDIVECEAKNKFSTEDLSRGGLYKVVHVRESSKTSIYADKQWLQLEGKPSQYPDKFFKQPNITTLLAWRISHV